MHKPIYLAAYHQSKFGKLMGMTVPEIVRNAVEGVCREAKTDPSAIDVGSIGATCHFSLNQQGLLAGLLADVPGLASKPIESVENACASGGQAVLSVVYKLLAGDGEVGIAVGYEKMRDAEGRWTASSSGRRWATSPTPTSGPGRSTSSRTSSRRSWRTT
jgi:acetyl-CoA acetyltransferase